MVFDIVGGVSGTVQKGRFVGWSYFDGKRLSS